MPCYKSTTLTLEKNSKDIPSRNLVEKADALRRSWCSLVLIVRARLPPDEHHYLVDYADINRDWKWLEFFYGYGAASKFGGTLLALAHVHIKAGFLAAVSLILFLALDSLVLSFLFLRFLVQKLK